MNSISNDSPAPPDNGSTLRTRLLWAFLVAVLLAIATTALLSRHWLEAASPSGEVLPVLGQVPAFELINRDGRTVSREDLLGRPWIADFVFTRCRVSCPVMTARMAELQGQVPPSVRLVSYSVDPQVDTPEVLEKYAVDFGAEPDWYFLTGSVEAIYELILKGFRLGVHVPSPEEAALLEEPITHSTRFVLVDGQGQIRGYYDAFDVASLNRLRRDAASLAASKG